MKPENKTTADRIEAGHIKLIGQLQIAVVMLRRTKHKKLHDVLSNSLTEAENVSKLFDKYKEEL